MPKVLLTEPTPSTRMSYGTCGIDLASQLQCCSHMARAREQTLTLKEDDPSKSVCSGNAHVKVLATGSMLWQTAS